MHANARTRTAGVGLGPCTVPAAGRPTFDLPEGSMDIGMGVHGEAGLRRGELASADEVAGMLLDLVLDDLPLDDSPSVWVLVNTLGATPLMEALHRAASGLPAAGRARDSDRDGRSWASTSPRSRWPGCRSRSLPRTTS